MATHAASSSGGVVTLATVPGTGGFQTHTTLKPFVHILHMFTCHSETLYEPFLNVFALWVPFLLGKEDRFPGKHLPHTRKELEWSSYPICSEEDFTFKRGL
jgi:hypothetical protein